MDGLRNFVVAVEKIDLFEILRLFQLEQEILLVDRTIWTYLFCLPMGYGSDLC